MSVSVSVRVAAIASLTAAAGTASGQAVWLGGVGLWTDPLNWSTALDPNGAVDVLIDDGNGVASVVSLTTVRSASTILIDAGDQLTIQNGATFSATSGFTNNGTVLLNSSNANGFSTDLTFGSTITLAGTGEIVLNDDPNNRLFSSNAVITLPAGGMIRGAGQLLVNSSGLVNNGTILGEGANFPLVIDPNGQGFVNNGVLRAVGAAGIDLTAGVYTNNTSIEIDASSRIDVFSGTTVIGGVIDAATGGVLNPSNGLVTYDNVFFTATTDVVQADATNVTFVGGFASDGSWLVNASNGTGFNTDFFFQGGGLIDGDVTLSDDPNNRLFSNNAVITLASGRTIRGAGQLLVNSNGMINSGTILGGGAANALVIDPNGQGFVNNGVLRAVGAAGIDLGQGVYTNNTSIEIDASSRIDVFSGTTVIGGVIDAATGGVLNPSTGLVTYQGVTFTATTDVVQADGRNVTFVGGFTSDGSWLVNASNGTGFNTDFFFQGGGLIDGDVTLSDDPNNRLFSNNAVITLAEGRTIGGAGQLLANSNGMVNNGTILGGGAANALVIDPNGQGFVNNGVLRAVGAAGIDLGQGVYTNASALEIDAGSRVDVSSGTTVIGGVIDAATGGVLNPSNGLVTYDNVFFTATTDVVQADGTNVTFIGGFASEGSWLVNASNGTGFSTDFFFQGGGLIDGDVTLSDDPNNRLFSDNAVITLASGRTIRGAGQLLGNFNGMVNNGTILGEGANFPLVIDPNGQGFVNNGVLRAVGAAGIDLGQGVYTNGTAIEIAAGSRVDVFSGTSIVGGVIDAEEGGVFNPSTGTAIYDGVFVTESTDVTQGDGFSVDIRNGLTHDGPWRLASLNSSGFNTTMTFLGSQTLGGNGTLFLSDDVNNRIVTNNSVITQAATHTIRGAGQLVANTGGMITHGTIILEDTAVPLTIDVNAFGYVATETALLTGSGVLNFQDGAMQNGGTIRPEAVDAEGDPVEGSVGLITMNAGGIANTGTAVYEVDVVDTATADRIDMAGPYTAGGTLRVGVGPGFTGAFGDGVDIITASSVTGAYSAIELDDASTLSGLLVARVALSGDSVRVIVSCDADVVVDGVLQFSDVTSFVNAFNASAAAADINGDGSVNFGDVTVFIAAFNSGCINP